MPDQPDIHSFDDAMALEAVGEGRMRGRTTEPYANMVGPFGGVTAAVMLRAVELQDERLGDPVAFTTNFVAAVSPGEFDILTRCVRTNRSTQHWIIEMTQQDRVVATATAVTGVHRETWSETEARPPQAPEPDAVPLAEKPPMAWPQQYEMRFVQGPLSFTGQPNDSSTTIMWTRDQPPRPLDFASLTALCDVFFPRVYVRTGQQMPIGTVSMTVYFHADAAEVAAQGSEHLLATAKGTRFDRGFFDQSAQLWGHDGTLLASSHQIVYYKG